MKEIVREVEDAVMRALDHAERREILRVVSLSETGTSYTELMGQLGLPTGKLNYQLRQLEGLVEKNEERRYVLTPLGRKAVALLGMISQDMDPAFEKYLKAARLVRRSHLQPLARTLILGLIASLSVVLVVYGYLTYIFLTEGGPFIMYVLLPILFLLGLGFLAWLIQALRNVPEALSRLERRTTSA
jgi:predicted transcriptional regulator